MIAKLTKKVEYAACKNRSFYRAAALYYKSIIKREIQLAGIHPSDRVLCIGGGPCPFSGILLHEYTGAAITIVDNDPACIRVSRRMIKRLGYADSITVLHGDGNRICPKEYSVVHMAAQVSPLGAVFCHLEKECSHGAKILVRVPKGGTASFCGIENRCCGKALYSGIKNVESTALYIKTGGNHEKSGNCSARSPVSCVAAAI